MPWRQLYHALFSPAPRHRGTDADPNKNGRLGRESVTRYQWLVLGIAWLGGVFDAMDATIYAIVLHPTLHDLLQSPGGTVSSEQVGWYGGIVFSVLLIGWAIGGICFGVIADHLGRTTTLIITILIYAIFTGLAVPSQNRWHLAIYRFLTALGIGEEWAAGVPLVAEILQLP